MLGKLNLQRSLSTQLTRKLQFNETRGRTRNGKISKLEFIIFSLKMNDTNQRT